MARDIGSRPPAKVRHRPAQIDTGLLQRCLGRLDDVVVEPSLWPEILTEISKATGGVGAILFRGASDARNAPHSPSMDESFRLYLKHNWQARDIRSRGIPLLLENRIVGDDDTSSIDDMKHLPFYNELIYPSGLRWFAGVGFRADRELWCLSIQRGLHDDMFSAQEKTTLETLSAQLSQTATLSKITGQAALNGFRRALSAVDQPAVLVARDGTVIEVNEQADRLFGQHLYVHNGRVSSRIPSAARDLASFMARLKRGGYTGVSDEYLALPRPGRRPLLMRAVHITGAARSPFGGADAILLLTDLDTLPRTSTRALQQAYRFTPAETKLAVRLGLGETLAEIAQVFGVSVETVRHQLKSALAKTGTHSQGELIRVVSRVPNDRPS